jgi:predicted peptidase
VIARALCLALLAPAAALAEVVTDTVEIDGIRIEYRAVLPDGYDPAQSYPVVLAFPGAGQTMRNVDRAIADNWRAEAERRAYVVVSPAAPEAGLFFQGGDAVFPGLLDVLRERYRPTGDRFHVAGISNGGASAFHVAASYPGYFISVTGLPGYLPYSTPAKIAALAGLCVYMHVGERDPEWAETMAFQAQALTDADGTVRFWVERGQEHVMDSLKGAGAARLFEHFAEAAGGCGP